MAKVEESREDASLPATPPAGGPQRAGVTHLSTTRPPQPWHPPRATPTLGWGEMLPSPFSSLQREEQGGVRTPQPTSALETEPGPAAPKPPRASLPHRGVLAVFDTLPMAGKIPCWGQGGLRAAGIPPVLAIIVLLAESSAP